MDKFRAILPLTQRFWHQYKVSIILLIFLGFLGGFLEGIGIGMIVPLFSLLIEGGELGQDIISRTLARFFSAAGIPPGIWSLLGIAAAIFLFKGAVAFLYGYLHIRTLSDYQTETRGTLYRRMLGTGWPHLLKQKIGYLENMLMKGVQYQTRMFKALFGIIKASAEFLMYLFVALSISLSATLVTLVSGSLLFLLFRPLARRVEIYSKQEMNLGKRLAHEINETVAGTKVIKAFAVEEKAAEKSLNLFRKLRDTQIKFYLVKSPSTAFWEPLSFVLIALIFAGFYNYYGSAFNIAAFAAVIYLIQRMFSHIGEVQRTIYAFNETLPYTDMVDRLFQETASEEESAGGGENFSFRRELEFRGVEFAYAAEKPVLSGLNFKIKNGEFTGIIGPSGAGKTTLVDLLLRLFNPQVGEICLDGAKITDISVSSWRDNIGYVAQDIFLKNGTIAENIRFFDGSISDKEVEEAAQKANLYDFISSLPQGFNTPVGERGVLLSGGQRQRVALARALARKPKILILDEATSTLDRESEEAIKAALEKLRGQVTIIAIAHNLSTILNADRVLVIKNGGIAEEGHPRELLNDKNSYFLKMHRLSSEVGEDLIPA